MAISSHGNSQYTVRFPGFESWGSSTSFSHVVCSGFFFVCVFSQSSHPLSGFFLHSSGMCSAWYCLVLQSIAEYCRVLQSVSEYCRVLQSIREYCRILQSVAECYRVFLAHRLGPIFGLVFFKKRISKELMFPRALPLSSRWNRSICLHV